MKTIFLIFIAVWAWPFFLSGQVIPVSVVQKNSKEVRGVLLSISPDAVVINPDGIVSKRIIPASEISKVIFADSNQEIAFPITDPSLLASLGYKQKIATAPNSGIRNGWALSITGGIGCSFYSVKQEMAQINFGTKSIFELCARYHFPRQYKGKPGKYIDMTYYNCQLKHTEQTVGLYGYYNANSQLKIDSRSIVTVHSISGDFGYTTGYSNNNSYLYFGGGLSFLILSKYETVGLKSSYMGLRASVGGIQRILPKLSLHLRVLLDLAVFGIGQNHGIAFYKNTMYETAEPGFHPETDGGGIYFSLGFLLDLSPF